MKGIIRLNIKDDDLVIEIEYGDTHPDCMSEGGCMRCDSIHSIPGASCKETIELSLLWWGQIIYHQLINKEVEFDINNMKCISFMLYSNLVSITI